MMEAVHLGMVGSSHEVTNQLLVEAYGVTFPYTLFEEQCRAAMKVRMAEAVPVKSGALEILKELRERSLPMAVATSSRRQHAHPHLKAAGLFELFDTIVTRDDVINPKPAPRALSHGRPAARRRSRDLPCGRGFPLGRPRRPRRRHADRDGARSRPAVGGNRGALCRGDGEPPSRPRGRFPLAKRRMAPDTDRI